MNGAHDLGGMHGYPDLGRERREPVFHHEWERRCFAITLGAGFLGRWNIDMSRRAREQMDPGEYLTTSYYEHWLHGLETLLVERGLLTREEIDARLAGGAGVPAAPTPGQPAALPACEVEAALRRGAPATVDVERPVRFQPGDRVRTANIHPTGHTRLPRYARGRRGAVRADRAVHVFPDAHATGGGKDPQRLYSVEFTARELWGEAASAVDTVCIDLWDSYLEPA